jgi:hypothetical protein
MTHELEDRVVSTASALPRWNLGVEISMGKTA